YIHVLFLPAPPPTAPYPLSLHDALPILCGEEQHLPGHRPEHRGVRIVQVPLEVVEGRPDPAPVAQLHEGAGMVVGEDLAGGALIDRKSTRLNSSHVSISYAVFCLKKKTE